MLIPARLTLSVLALVLLLAVACREPFRIVGGSTPRAQTRARAIQVFHALSARMTDPQRDAKYDLARVRIANAAMLPSRVWNDTASWTSATESRRSLQIAGHFAAPRFHLETRRVAPPPAGVAETRHVINLTRLTNTAYAWDTDVTYGIGTVPAADVAAYMRAFFASAEGRDEAAVRADLAAFAPRTAAAMAQVFRIDSIRTHHFADSSTLATFAVSMHPENVEARLPIFAEFLRRYYVTAKLKMSVVDHSGATYMELTSERGHFLMRVRTRHGAMVSLASPANPMPDSLGLVGALTMRLKGFTVGFRDYRPEFTIIRTDHEASWSVISRREPTWVLPLITERLLRTPLRRPFQGSGAMFRIGVRDSVGGQSIGLRRLHLEVQESAILRFIGRLGSTAVDDYQGRAEREQQLWLREVFEAVIADLTVFSLGG